ncbi:MAG: SAM-dependent chlorinase/fluorinase [Gammaproteobacteria bacterium]|nr:SAM-dependent chlorinase/fluorinase [Gammaproteobacteria bacterium]NIR84213.1 SAM-dependent chlorinase/fluorinase [Gammaproteobacteria bacterium]NIR89683.1 SAM-dependent chlorinase/fluorinase [Gammaproteobacteria bacterium]NIU05371.1 SAM-dependent chlorinase/fluorinase [Gammaproteobacteria bacterium]NIV52317.1 hypothetical protein [Gammaproteobacteria bacterium]
MIALFTDFGPTGPYVGQMRAVLYRDAPEVPVVDLLCDVPPFNPRAGAHLLAALASELPEDTVFLCVIDPGVGSGDRLPVVVTVDRRRFVGPDNGLFDVVAARGRDAQRWEITWQPPRLVSTFHGRDLFAPVAARLARGVVVEGRHLETRSAGRGARAAEDLLEIIYVDHFGNAMSGVRAGALPQDGQVVIGGRQLGYASTYAEVPPGTPFWYANSIGLIEIAVNQGRADEALGLAPGHPIELRATA